MTKPDPKPDPHWVKETLVEDYVNVARRNGQDVSSTAVERLALGDLATYEAVTREQKPRVQTKKPQPEGVSKAAQKAAAETGWEVTKKPIGKKGRYTAFLNKAPSGPRQAAAIMRLGQILNPRSYFRPSKEFDYRLPRLAQEFAEAMQRLDMGTGEYEGKSAEDCERIMWRRVEDICDRSTGSLGFWWVK